MSFIPKNADKKFIRKQLGKRSIVMVGLMGAGKSSVGRRLAVALDMPFLDADNEIETAAGMSITDIFALHGEEAFRDGERRVIARLLEKSLCVLATGGGAYMDAETREQIAANSVSIWLKADLPVLMERVRRRPTRPLLLNDDPEAVMRNLMEIRYPVYEQADIAVQTSDASHDEAVYDVVRALKQYLAAERVKAGNV